MDSNDHGGNDIAYNRRLDFTKNAPPLYIQLGNILKGMIERGEFVKGDLIPTEKQLMDMYSVSRVTVRQAVSLLSQQGLVCGRRGIGTEIIYEKIEEDMNSVISFTEEMKKHNIEMTTSFCEIKEVDPDKTVAQQLHIPLTEKCYCLTRVRDVDERPIVYTVTYLKASKKIKKFPLDSELYMESLYRYVREAYGVQIVSGEDILEAATASETVRRFLKLDENIPVFIRTRKTFLDDGDVFEYSKCYYPGSRYKYRVKL